MGSITRLLFGGMLFAGACLPAAAQVLRVGAASFPPARGNPFSFVVVPGVWIYAAMFDSITGIDGQGLPVPQLAISWQRVSPTLWRFELRHDVAFSNGELFDAGAIVAAFDYLKSDEGRITRAAIQVNTVAAVKADGEHAILVETSVPDPTLPARLAAIRIPAPRLLDELGMTEFAARPVGTGPFHVATWGAAQITLSAHDIGWRKPKIRSLEFRLIPEGTARLQALMSGSLDIAFALDPEIGPELETVGAKLVSERSAANLNIALRTAEPGPLRDLRVRQALNYAVNKRLMVDTLLAGQSAVASQMVPPGVPGYDPSIEPYSYDPDRARALLAEAGYPDGFKLTIEAAVAGGSNSGALYTMVASDLGAVGVETTVDIQPNAETLRKILNGGWHGDAFVMTTDAMPSLDPLTPFSYFSCGWPAPWYCDEGAMPLIAQAAQELDDMRRAALVNQLLRRYRDDAAMIYLFQLANFTGVAPRVRGYRSDFGIIGYDQIGVGEP